MVSHLLQLVFDFKKVVGSDVKQATDVTGNSREIMVEGLKTVHVSHRKPDNSLSLTLSQAPRWASFHVVYSSLCPGHP
jgi:hypothetical protein